MSTSQNAAMLCRLGVKAGMDHSMCRWQVKLCDPPFTSSIPEHFRGDCSQYKALFKSPINFTLLLLPAVQDEAWFTCGLVLISMVPNQSLHNVINALPSVVSVKGD